MNPFEKGLRNEIPLEVAADYFIKLKYGSAENMDRLKLAELQAKMKEKASELPPTAMGMNMPPVQPQKLPDSAMGKHAGVPAKKKGVERLGELLTGSRKAVLEKSWERSPKARAVSGIFRGHSAKTRYGERVLADLQNERSGVAAARGGAVAVTGTAAYGAKKLHDKSKEKKASPEEKFKLALSGMFGEGISAPGSVAPQVDMSQYMEMEQMGAEAEEANQAEFLRAKLEAANAELQAARDQAMQAQQTAQQLQMTQAQHEQQLQAAQQQSQLATQAAMQNVQQAHQLAMQATSQALQAKDDAINTHSLAAKMRMAYQDLRGNIMDAVAQDAAAPVGEAIKAQGALAAAPPPEMGVDPTGAPPPEMGAPEGAPADQAAGAEAAPGTAPAGGAPQEGAAPPSPPPAEDGATGEGPKVANVSGDMFGAALGHLKQKAPYALAGAALGGGLTAIESRVGHEGLRKQVQGLEAQPGGGFGKALRLAAAKARLAVGDAVERHPVPATFAGAAMGAGAGMSLGPGIMEGFQMLPGRLRELRKG